MQSFHRPVAESGAAPDRPLVATTVNNLCNVREFFLYLFISAEYRIFFVEVLHKNTHLAVDMNTMLVQL